MKILYISVFLFLYVLHTNADENETNLSTKVGKVPDIKKDGLVHVVETGDSPIPYTTALPDEPDNNKTTVVPPTNGTTPAPNVTTSTSTPKPTTLPPSTTPLPPKTTTLPPNATTISPNTTTPATNTTTMSPNTTTPASNTTTPAPHTTTSASNTTTITPNTTTPVTPVKPTQRFDFPSFIGGMMLTLGLMAIAFVAHKFYKARTDRNYHTL